MVFELLTRNCHANMRAEVIPFLDLVVKDWLVGCVEA